MFKKIRKRIIPINNERQTQSVRGACEILSSHTKEIKAHRYYYPFAIPLINNNINDMYLRCINHLSI